MFSSRDQPDGLNELIPGLPLSRQHPLTCRRQPIETAPTLARLLDPRSFNPAALLEAIQQRIERVEVEHQPPARLRLDQLAEFVAVPRSASSTDSRSSSAAPFFSSRLSAGRSMSVIGRYYTLRRDDGCNGCSVTEEGRESGRERAQRAWVRGKVFGIRTDRMRNTMRTQVLDGSYEREHRPLGQR